ncbi:PIR-like protein [Plasmodium relictum]|uniref:PIR-like protein n=1 Tax=Plasmodium relictum TaxID=85471 RepID=A0A1J1GJY0_PLARL|nr:PIR-like protein [Plasmodium relictum]CRG84084.1 PIR-like protein [Plasmodium relictum]
MIPYIFFLILILQYFCKTNLEIKYNNLNKIPIFKNRRALAEQQLGSLNRTVRSVDIESEFNTWQQSIQGELDNILSKLSSNFTLDNIGEYVNWAYNKSREITKTLNINPDPEKKSILNHIYDLWNKAANNYFLDSALDYYVREVMLGGQTNNSSSESTTLPPSTPLPATPSSPTTTSLINNALSTVSNHITTIATGQTENMTTSTSNEIVNGIATVEKGISSDSCSEFFCDPKNFSFLTIPLAVVGIALFLAYVYKKSRIRSFLGKNYIKKEKGKKRLHEMEMDNTVNSSKPSKETGQREAKRSRLDSFLRAFGYGKKFPYIDEDVGDTTIL